MSTHTPTVTLRTLALERPASIPVLERFGLDYCCGGKRSLADACAQRGVDPGAVLSAIEAREAQPGSAPERNWEQASMTELADHIEQTHHAFTREALERLAYTVPKVIAAHGGDRPELVEVGTVVRRLTDELRDHMVREERVLFPWLRRLDRATEIQSAPPWSVQRPISCMEHDHDEVGRALESLRSLTNGYTPPPGACGTYRSMLKTLEELERDTHTHIHKENNILFPAGLRAEQDAADRGHIAGNYAPGRGRGV